MGNPLTKAGNFTRPVTILKRAVTGTNSHNEEVAGAPTEIETLASVKPAPGTERFQSAEKAAEAPMRFVLRWRPGLLGVIDAIRFDGRVFEAVSVLEIGTREGIEVIGVARAE